MALNPIKKWDEVHGQDASEEKLTAFLESKTDQYAILQLRRTEENVEERFLSMREREKLGLPVDIDHYEVVYTAPLAHYQDLSAMLEDIYVKFKVDRPENFYDHSLSASDIVALQQNGAVNCYYVDSVGFKELPGILKPENYLKNAEMAMEDDYSMLDGIVNNGSKAEREPASVLEQLKEKQQALPSTPVRKCCEERER